MPCAGNRSDGWDSWASWHSSPTRRQWSSHLRHILAMTGWPRRSATCRQSAPSRRLWKQLAALYDVGSVVCATCVAIYASDRKVSTRLFRLGVYLFACMTWVSNVGYAAFPLPDGGKEIASFQETMHIVVTMLVVVLSIASLVCLIVNGYRDRRTKGLGICAAIALAMMLVGAVGQGIVDPRYFGVVERFSVFSAVGFNAVLGINLFCGFKGMGGIEHG